MHEFAANGGLIWRLDSEKSKLAGRGNHDCTAQSEKGVNKSLPILKLTRLRGLTQAVVEKKKPRMLRENFKEI